MKRKIFFAALIFLGVALFVWAKTDPGHWLHTGDHTYENGTVDFKGTLKIDGTEVTSTATELNLMDGVTATANEINAAADASVARTTASLTNSATLTLSANTPIVAITGTGGADDTTNTITIATPYPLYVTFTLYVTSTSSNLIKIADDGTTMAIGSDWIADNTDTLVIYTAATNRAYKVGGSNN